MLGSQPLMAAPLSQGLRSLQNAARSLGVFLDVHLFRPLSPRPIRHAGNDAMASLRLGCIWGRACLAQERQGGACHAASMKRLAKLPVPQAASREGKTQLSVGLRGFLGIGL